MSQEELKKEQIQLDRTIEKIKDQTYYVWQLVDRKGDHFKKGIHLAGDDIAYRRGKEDERLLKQAEKEPYFGRLDMLTEEEGMETFYIGKQGIRDNDENVIVLDWRMPLASVFYNYTSGHPVQNYTVDLDENGRIKQTYSVKVTCKKEFKIKDQKIMKILKQVPELDSEQTITITETGEEMTLTDEFLREIIQNSETSGYLKEIITTIQREQDLAIRQPLDINVIIQGVAGSGKSSIALHRLSYLLYNNKHISPEEVLILGPTNLFLDSIKELLPQLDLEGIQQATIQQLMIQWLEPLLKVKSDTKLNNYFEDTLFQNNHPTTRKIIEFKGSESFALLLDCFAHEFKKQYESNIQPLSFRSKELERDQLIEFFNGYEYLPFAKRIKRFLSHVENKFNDLLEETIQELQDDYHFVVQDFLKNGGLGAKEYHSLVKQMQRVHQHRLKMAKNEHKEVFTLWKKRMSMPDLFSLYKQVMSYELINAFKHELNDHIPDLFQDYEIEQLSYFDLAPLFYLYLQFYDKPVNFKHIVVDEGQDLSFLQFAILKKITKTMTILGDKDQSIFLDYGQYDWESLVHSLFDSEQDMILTLETSYRSTKEIIEVANTVLINQKGAIHKPMIPLNRNGEEVQFIQVSSGKDLMDSIESTLHLWKHKYKRIAIIHKDEPKAKQLAKYLKEDFNIEAYYINPDNKAMDNTISVLASYHCKGLEFDAVILVNVNETDFPKDDLHARLLYVLLTRAQQEVRVFYSGKPSPLLEGLIDRVEKIGMFEDIL